jgi:polynucleotide 5'-hydroxyl-kinase GRC3/NOL9
MAQADIPEDWRRSAATVLQERPRVVLLLGGTDLGKSSYCRFLADALASAGERVAIVDADVGQKSIGPPATVTLGYATGAPEAWATPPEVYYFVGSPNPVGRMLPLVIGTSQLVQAAEAPFVIVDTTGLVEGPGRALKSYKIEAVRPDLIVAIARGSELDAILRPYRGHRTVRIRPSPKARARDRAERDLARERSFALYFREARRLELAIDDVIFQRSLLFSGEPVPLPGAIYAERSAEGLVAVAEGETTDRKPTRWIKRDFERNLLCGVVDGRGHGLGLAILERFDFGGRRLALRSPVPPEKLKTLQFGGLYLGRDGRELGRLDRAEL